MRSVDNLSILVRRFWQHRKSRIKNFNTPSVDLSWSLLATEIHTFRNAAGTAYKGAVSRGDLEPDGARCTVHRSSLEMLNRPVTDCARKAAAQGPRSIKCHMRSVGGVHV